jgi:hypothetical protein
VALQAVHALWGLLDYPLTVLIAVLAYTVIAAPFLPPGAWLAEARTRIPRLLPIVTNLIMVFPLLLTTACNASTSERALPHRSVLAELTSVLNYAGGILFLYVTWLGWQRRYLLTEIRRHQLVPLLMVFITYLLGALVNTGRVAEIAAVELLTGSSPAVVQVTFVTRPGVLPELAEHDLLLGAEWQRNDLVFDRHDGGFMDQDVVRKSFSRAIKRNPALPVITPHGLRHTMATIMLGAGVNPRIVQERLGHSTIQMTLDRYSHVSLTMRSDAAAIIDAKARPIRGQDAS